MASQRKRSHVCCQSITLHGVAKLAADECVSFEIWYDEARLFPATLLDDKISQRCRSLSGRVFARRQLMGI